MTWDGRSAADGVWTAYTPTWSSTGTAPTVGNGTLVGFYELIGKTCRYRIVLTFGSTTNIGSGNYIFSPPFPALLGLHGPPHGLAELFDTSTPTFAYYALVPNTTTQVACRAMSNGALLNAALPWTWANGDVIAASGQYEIA